MLGSRFGGEEHVFGGGLLFLKDQPKMGYNSSYSISKKIEKMLYCTLINNSLLINDLMENLHNIHSGDLVI